MMKFRENPTLVAGEMAHFPATDVTSLPTNRDFVFDCTHRRVAVITGGAPANLYVKKVVTDSVVPLVLSVPLIPICACVIDRPPILN